MGMLSESVKAIRLNLGETQDAPQESTETTQDSQIKHKSWSLVEN